MSFDELRHARENLERANIDRRRQLEEREKALAALETKLKNLNHSQNSSTLNEYPVGPQSPSADWDKLRMEPGSTDDSLESNEWYPPPQYISAGTPGVWLSPRQDQPHPSSVIETLPRKQHIPTVPLPPTSPSSATSTSTSSSGTTATSSGGSATTTTSGSSPMSSQSLNPPEGDFPTYHPATTGRQGTPQPNTSPPPPSTLAHSISAAECNPRGITPSPMQSSMVTSCTVPADTLPTTTTEHHLVTDDGLDQDRDFPVPYVENSPRSSRGTSPTPFLAQSPPRVPIIPIHTQHLLPSPTEVTPGRELGGGDVLHTPPLPPTQAHFSTAPPIVHNIDGYSSTSPTADQSGFQSTPGGSGSGGRVSIGGSSVTGIDLSGITSLEGRMSPSSTLSCTSQNTRNLLASVSSLKMGSEATNSRLTGAVDELLSALNEKESEVDKANTLIAQLQQTVQYVRRTYKQRDQSARELQDSYEVQQQEINKYRHQLKEVESQAEYLRKQLEDQQVQYFDKIGSMAEEMRKLKSDLKAARQQKVVAGQFEALRRLSVTPPPTVQEQLATNSFTTADMQTAIDTYKKQEEDIYNLLYNILVNKLGAPQHIITGDNNNLSMLKYLERSLEGAEARMGELQLIEKHSSNLFHCINSTDSFATLKCVPLPQEGGAEGGFINRLHSATTKLECWRDENQNLHQDNAYLQTELAQTKEINRVMLNDLSAMGAQMWVNEEESFGIFLFKNRNVLVHQLWCLYEELLLPHILCETLCKNSAISHIQSRSHSPPPPPPSSGFSTHPQKSKVDHTNTGGRGSSGSGGMCTVSVDLSAPTVSDIGVTVSNAEQRLLWILQNCVHSSEKGGFQNIQVFQHRLKATGAPPPVPHPDPLTQFIISQVNGGCTSNGDVFLQHNNRITHQPTNRHGKVQNVTVAGGGAGGGGVGGGGVGGVGGGGGVQRSQGSKVYGDQSSGLQSVNTTTSSSSSKNTTPRKNSTPSSAVVIGASPMTPGVIGNEVTRGVRKPHTATSSSSGGNVIGGTSRSASPSPGSTAQHSQSQKAKRARSAKQAVHSTAEGLTTVVGDEITVSASPASVSQYHNSKPTTPTIPFQSVQTLSAPPPPSTVQGLRNTQPPDPRDTRDPRSWDNPSATPSPNPPPHSVGPGPGNNSGQQQGNRSATPPSTAATQPHRTSSPSATQRAGRITPTSRTGRTPSPSSSRAGPRGSITNRTTPPPTNNKSRYTSPAAKRGAMRAQLTTAIY